MSGLGGRVGRIERAVGPRDDDPIVAALESVEGRPRLTRAGLEAFAREAPADDSPRGLIARAYRERLAEKGVEAAEDAVRTFDAYIAHKGAWAGRMWFEV